MRAEIRTSRNGSVRVELWVNALLNDGDDEGVLPEVVPNVISLWRARLELTRRLVAVIDERHRVLKRYPVLAALAETHGWEPEALGQAYLRHLRRHLDTASGRYVRPRLAVAEVVGLASVHGAEGAPEV